MVLEDVVHMVLFHVIQCQMDEPLVELVHDWSYFIVNQVVGCVVDQTIELLMTDDVPGIVPPLGDFADLLQTDKDCMQQALFDVKLPACH